MTSDPAVLPASTTLSRCGSNDEGSEHRGVAEYHRLFAQDLVGRERTESGVRFRFRSRGGLFDEVTWDASVIDDPVARRILDGLYALPDHPSASVTDLVEQFASQGLDFT